MVLSLRSSLLAAALAAASLVAQAGIVNLAADGQWNDFTVNPDVSVSTGLEWIDAHDSNAASYGTALSFNFTIAQGMVGTFSVVDTSYAGDVFAIYDNGQFLGTTSLVSVPAGGYANAALEHDPELAFNNTAFSRGVFTLAEGAHIITGKAIPAFPDDLPITDGSVKLTTSPVPEPSSVSLLLAALGIAFVASRRVTKV
jgi:hypothetical protein